MRFEVLGSLRMLADGRMAAVSGVLRQRLLALLLVRANQPVSVDLLTEALWSTPTDSAAQKLRLHVHKLRKALDDPGRLTFDSGGYRLRVEGGELDADRFTQRHDEAVRVADQDPLRCAQLLREALGLWRGGPYQGIDLTWIEGDVLRLSERRIAATEDLYAAEIRCGRYGAVVGELSALVGQNPLREKPYALLMTALYQSDRQAEALAVYRRAHRTLVDSIGVEPGPRLRELEERCLRGEPLETVDLTASESAREVVPAQLPAAGFGFVGREEALSALDELLSSLPPGSVPMAVVSGIGGIGKTTLAVNWAHRVKDRFVDGQLYVDLGGWGTETPREPADVLGAFLRALGVDGAAVPEAPSERSALFRSMTDGKRLLLLLDNANRVEQVRSLLPGSVSCCVLITSRDPLVGLTAREGARRIALEPLSAAEARQLLRERLGALPALSSDVGAADALARACAHMPLALRLAAEWVRERPWRRVPDLVAELADERARLDVLDGAGDSQTSVRAVFTSSYRRLDGASARLFRLLGLQPGHDIEIHAIAALAGSSAVRDVRNMLETLVRSGLVEESAAGRHRLHDLLRAYAAELSTTTDSAQERRAALTRLFDFFLDTASMAAHTLTPHDWESTNASTGLPVVTFASGEWAGRWLHAELDNLMRAAAVAGNWQLQGYTIALSEILTWYLDLARNADDARKLHTLALEAAQSSGDSLAEARCLRALGLLYSRQDQLEEAELCFDSGFRCLEGLENKSAASISQAGMLNCLGMMRGYSGRAEEAEQHLRKSVELYVRHDRALHAALPLVNLGLLYRRMGRHSQALDALQDALSRSQAHGHTAGQAHASYGLAGLYRETGDYDAALDAGTWALNFGRRSAFPALVALSSIRLASVHRRLGDNQAARHCYHQALEIARSTTNRRMEATTLNGIAETCVAADAWQEAVRHHSAALAAAHSGGVRYEQARAYSGMGAAYHAQGETAQAVSNWRQALTLYEQLGARQSAVVRRNLEELSTPPSGASCN